MSDSDSLYHRLFSHPGMVEELVREFVPEALAAGLDFSGLQRVNPKFHFRRRSGRRREGDVIWRLPTCKGADIYLYLLMEFPETGELIALAPDSALWPWQPRARYYLLDIGAFPQDGLARRSSLAALLFRLEQRRSSEEFKELVGEVIGWFRQHENFERLRGLFAELIREALAELRVKVPLSEDLLEMKSNLSTWAKTWKQQWRDEGKAEGRVEGLARGKAEGRVEGLARGKAEGKVEGLAEGKAEGKAEALLCLLVERFGAVAPPWRKRIRGANLVTLDRWFKRAIAARDLSSVFEPRR